MERVKSIRKAWEYRTVRVECDDEKSTLDAYGRDGWELAAVIREAYGTTTKLYLKRPM